MTLADTHTHLTKILAHFTEDTLDDIERCAANTHPASADGYPPRASGNTTEGGRSTNELTSVESAADRNLHGIHDPVAQHAAAINQAIRQAAALIDHADRQRTLIARQRNAARAQQAPTCTNCGEPAIWPDRPTAKAGRCQRCYHHRARHDHDYQPTSNHDHTCERCLYGNHNPQQLAEQLHACDHTETAGP